MTTDTQFVTHLVDLDAKGKDGLSEMRDYLRDNGGMRRVITLLAESRTKKERKPRALRIEIDGFAEWYAAFPRHVARDDAARAYIQARKAAEPEELLAGAKRYAGRVKGTATEFIKMPATWLRAGCWKDEYPMPVSASGVTVQATIDIWVWRLEGWLGLDLEFPKGSWNEKWGFPPDHPQTSVPAAAHVAFAVKHNPKTATNGQPSG